MTVKVAPLLSSMLLSTSTFSAAAAPPTAATAAAASSQGFAKNGRRAEVPWRRQGGADGKTKLRQQKCTKASMCLQGEEAEKKQPLMLDRRTVLLAATSFFAASSSFLSGPPSIARAEDEEVGGVIVPPQSEIVEEVLLAPVPVSPSPPVAKSVTDGVPTADNNDLIRKLKEKSDSLREERQKERLDAYYKKNFKEYFEFVEGSYLKPEDDELHQQIRKWLSDNK